MNFSEIKLNHPVKIIQVYRHIRIYGKENKPEDKIKIVDPWISGHSLSGQYRDGILHLSVSEVESSQLVNLDLILMIHDMLTGTSISEKETERINFFNLTHPKKWGIFEFSLIENIELHLKYDHFAVGQPSREDFKLSEIKPHLPVEIKNKWEIRFFPYLKEGKKL